MDLGPSNSLHDGFHHTNVDLQPRNPYARIPSRRAIACVTCAKAKTKCDKALPSCSRCITKGIKCEPRSTRRTSEISQRSKIRKCSIPLRRYQSTINRPGRSSSPQSLIPLNGMGNLHGLSHDYFTTANTGEKVLELSGFPILSPLPSDTPEAFGASYLYTHTLGYESVSYEHDIPQSGLSSLGPLSPSTPELIDFQEPRSATQGTECDSYPQMWHGRVPEWTEHMIDPSTSAVLPTGHWDTSNGTMTMPSPQSMDMQPNIVFEQSHMPKPLISRHDMHSFFGNSLSSGDYTLNPIPDWMIFQPTYADLSTATSVPFLPEMQYDWEDVFIFGPSPCHNFYIQEI